MGHIVAYTSCMYGGKTKALLEDLNDAMRIQEIPCVLFKPRIDKRFGDDAVVRSHDRIYQFLAEVVDSVSEIRRYLSSRPNIKRAYLEEGNLMDHDLVQLCRDVVDPSNKLVLVIATLMQTFAREPFPLRVPGARRTTDSRLTIADALAYSSEIHTLTKARCVYKDADGNKCNRPAHYTQRLVDGVPAPRTDIVLAIAASTDHPEVGEDGYSRSYTCVCDEHGIILDNWLQHKEGLRIKEEEGENFNYFRSTLPIFNGSRN